MHIRTVASIATLSAFPTFCLGSLWGNNEQNPLSWLSGGSQTKQPNIVFILTDDQDLHMNSLDYVPLIRKHLIEQGTLFTKHFCTTAICCPARASILTGMLSHNTNVTDVSPPYGKQAQW
jgi:hypothetical protein